MKKSIVLLMAVSLFTAAVPAMALDHHASHSAAQMDEQCVKDCDKLLRDCSNEVDSIQERIAKLQAAINTKASSYTRDQLNALKAKLADAKETLEHMEQQ